MESGNRFVPVEIRDSGKNSTGIESGNRFVPVKISEYESEITDIESRNLTCARRRRNSLNVRKSLRT